MSGAARRIVIAIGLLIVFGIGVAAIILPAQERALILPAANAPSAAPAAAPNGANDLRPEQTASPADASAAARDKAESPPQPPDANAPGPKQQ